MKTSIVCMLMLVGTAWLAHAELSEVEAKYLREFAGYTGGMGIGFVPEHTYDYRFRQAVLKSKDEVVQKAFILQKLPFHISSILADLKNNQKMIGKAQYRELTPEERTALIESFEESMKLLEKLDANKNKYFYKKYRDAFDAIQAQKR